MSRKRTFLFLQGPPGPLFHRLGSAMADRGIIVHRINICGGDDRDWPDASVRFRGRFSEWPAFFDRFLREHRVTDLMLFGDCRPYHLSAHAIAQLRSVRTHVLEEGYIRPHWMTLEPEGVNARSTLSRDKSWFLREAKRLPPEPELPPVTASFRRRARDSYWYFYSAFFGRLRYPHYRSHRPTSIFMEMLGWAWKLSRDRSRSRKSEQVLAMLQGEPFFVFPLQLSSDYQIRTHSLFPDMQSAATSVIESFAAFAPADVRLVLKSHPLDSSFFNWHRFVRRLARRLNIESRLHMVDGGELGDLARRARGLVCVNSTSATLALAHGTPVCTVGEAVYDIDGLTYQGHLDTFWIDPKSPEPGVYQAFRRVLIDRSLVRGGLASESAVQVLIRSILQRLGILRRRLHVRGSTHRTGGSAIDEKQTSSS
ncbi:MAG: capsular biosynthesis protein [Pseudomonadota bacterium]|nr:capsular biosynthesis protein [Pseudomonadota bacterium]